MSYADSFGAALDHAGLPWDRLDVEAEAHSASAASGSHLDSITVSATIQGGAPGTHDRYRDAAKVARDANLAANAVRGNVAYKVGGLTIVARSEPGDPARRDLSARETEQSSVELAARHMLAFNEHRESAVVERLHTNCVIEDVALGQTYTGRHDAVACCRRWWDRLDATVIDPAYHHDGASAVTIEARCVGRRFRGPRTHTLAYRDIEIRFAAVLRFSGGLLAEVRIYYDTAAARRQLAHQVCGRQGCDTGNRLQSRMMGDRL